jgi:hypothetical protein
LCCSAIFLNASYIAVPHAGISSGWAVRSSVLVVIFRLRFCLERSSNGGIIAEMPLIAWGNALRSRIAKVEVG